MTTITRTAGEEYPVILKAFDRLEGVVVDFNDPEGQSLSRTKQAFKEECDINVIIQKWQSTGITDHINLARPSYLDYDTPDDYLDAVNRVISAQNSFDALPSAVRSRFQNDPQQLLAFLQDGNNHEEAQSLGLLEEAATPAPTPAPASPAEPSAGTPPEATGTPVSGGKSTTDQTTS